MAWTVTELTKEQETIQIVVPKRWYSVLKRLCQLESEGHELAMIQFVKGEPHCRKVGKLEK